METDYKRPSYYTPPSPPPPPRVSVEALAKCAKKYADLPIADLRTICNIPEKDKRDFTKGDLIEMCLINRFV